MKGSPNGVSAFDPRILSLLGTLHDVQGAPKTAIYPNGSAKNKLESLIARGFVLERPVPFSNTRYCSITDRGRVLFEALTLIEAIWDSEPTKELGFQIVGNARADHSEGESGEASEEAVARTPSAVETVQVVLPVEEPEDWPVSKEPVTEPLNEDEKVGVNVSETESADPTSEGGEE